MSKKDILTRENMTAWCNGHRHASRIIRRERDRRLASITPEESLTEYLDLKRLDPVDRAGGYPSPVLASMRRALGKLT